MDDRDFSHVLAFPKDRKGERKTKRKLKKVVKRAYFSHANVEEALFFELNLKPEDFAEVEELPIFEKRLTFIRGLWGAGDW
ncbi:hypothetical protein M3Y99_02002100 [Aphelenchoides fujianensis]|nr:hypothetical protein M3Y99_02002100 [Aphelenchoides fujianensis]